MTRRNGSQLNLDLALDPIYKREDFLVASCNSDAVAWLEKWPDWPGGGLVLYGPPGCGKSHLLEIWRKKTGAVIINGQELVNGLGELYCNAAAVAVDHSDKADERALLRIYNGAIEGAKTILLTACSAPKLWPVKLPDLRSRMMALPLVGIGEPDDLLLQAVLVKQFSDRQLMVETTVVRYLLVRMERSFEMARRVVEELDSMVVSQGRRVTTVLASKALERLEV